MKGPIPTGVLAQALGDRIGGRRVRAAVFTTYSFDPGFFELHVLPVLFDQPFRQADKLKRIQLEDALRDLDHVAVYFDQTALAADGGPAQLDYRRIDIRRRTGVFHPKLVLVLVEETDPELEGMQSLVVGISSANLTRAGWWENVECAHFEEIGARDLEDERVSWRSDLMKLLVGIRNSSGSGEDHGALEEIRTFLRRQTNPATFSRAKAGGRWHTRIFYGQDKLANWLRELRLDGREWNLEIVSPFFPPAGAGPLEGLLESLAPRETRVYLPQDPETRAALVSEKTYRAIEEVGAKWSVLPGELLSRGRSTDLGRQPPRRVHAKTYRLWSKEHGDIQILGSVNLSAAAHGHSRSGNFEAAWLVDVSDSGLPRRWWLRPLDRPVETFVEKADDEREGHDRLGLDLSLRFDWGARTLSYRFGEPTPCGVAVGLASGRPLFSFTAKPSTEWRPVPTADVDDLAQVLRSTTLFRATARDLDWTILVREENLAYRPSLLETLTPEEILEYWALLTPEQRAVFLEKRIEASLEGLPVGGNENQPAPSKLFDGFAGIFHAFGCLRRHVAEAIAEDRPREAESRLFGAKYDSLPSLLRKTLDRREAKDEKHDPINAYVTFLCARQLWDGVRREHADFVAERRKTAADLEQLLGACTELRGEVGLDADEGEAFLDWYERSFLTEAARVGVSR